MSYFCRIQLDYRHPQALDAACTLGGGAYSDHRLLWRFFPAPVGAARDFLFRRIEPRAEKGSPLFYCVAPRPAVAPHPAWRVDSAPYKPVLELGDRLRFSLRVNPVQAHRRADGKSRRDDVVMHAKKAIMQRHGVARWSEVPTGDRVPLYDLAARAIGGWFRGADGVSGAAARHGFRVLGDLAIDSYGQHGFRRDNNKPARVSTVDLSGTIEVIDSAASVNALHNGIGHAKGFGCGLLLVRRA